MEGEEKCVKVLVVKPECWGLLRRPRQRWVNSAEVGLKRGAEKCRGCIFLLAIGTGGALL